MERLTDKSCADFAEVLASKASTPGGGGAAALVGALGIALCSMVGNFTVGKKKYADVEDDIKSILSKAEEIRLELLNQVEADALAFAPLAKAYSIPKDDPSRAEVLENATLQAITAPNEMVRLCCECIELLEEMLTKGSVMLISDVGCGALMCKAALESAAMNVFINTQSLQDKDKANQIEADIDSKLLEYSLRAQKVADEVTSRIRKES